MVTHQIDRSIENQQRINCKHEAQEGDKTTARITLLLDSTSPIPKTETIYSMKDKFADKLYAGCWYNRTCSGLL